MFWLSLVFGAVFFFLLLRIRNYILLGKSPTLSAVEFSYGLSLIILIVGITTFITLTQSEPPKSLDACLEDPECTVETRVMNCIEVGFWERPFISRRCREASEEKYETVVFPDLDAGGDAGTEPDLDAGFDGSCM